MNTATSMTPKRRAVCLYGDWCVLKSTWSEHWQRHHCVRISRRTCKDESSLNQAAISRETSTVCRRVNQNKLHVDCIASIVHFTSKNHDWCTQDTIVCHVFVQLHMQYVIQVQIYCTELRIHARDVHTHIKLAVTIYIYIYIYIYIHTHTHMRVYRHTRTHSRTQTQHASLLCAYFIFSWRNW